MNLKAGALGLLKFVALLTFLYFFICSLTFLTDAFRLIAGRTAGKCNHICGFCSIFIISSFTFSGSVFSGDLLSNPIVGLMIGVLFTVLVQSSSTCTTVVVSMVASERKNSKDHSSAAVIAYIYRKPSSNINLATDYIFCWDAER